MLFATHESICGSQRREDCRKSLTRKAAFAPNRRPYQSLCLPAGVPSDNLQGRLRTQESAAALSPGTVPSTIRTTSQRQKLASPRRWLRCEVTRSPLPSLITRWVRSWVSLACTQMSLCPHSFPQRHRMLCGTRTETLVTLATRREAPVSRGRHQQPRSDHGELSDVRRHDSRLPVEW